MNWTLEMIVVPVTDVDRAKKFYVEQVGFNLDFDSRGPDGNGPIQMTPKGSGCSIGIGKGLSEMAPGTMKGLQLVVNDLPAARAELLERGVEVSEIVVFSETGPRPRQEGDDLNNVGFVSFSDPDGNKWAVQQITSRS